VDARGRERFRPLGPTQQWPNQCAEVEPVVCAGEVLVSGPEPAATHRNEHERVKMTGGPMMSAPKPAGLRKGVFWWADA
jgi:hypothetical protein